MAQGPAQKLILQNAPLEAKIFQKWTASSSEVLPPPTLSLGPSPPTLLLSPQKFPNSSASSSAPSSFAVANPDHFRRLISLGGMGRSKRSSSAASSLPEDPLVEILSRVPGKSLCRFKCVSKAWYGLIADLLRHKKLPETLEGFFFFVSDRCDGDSGSADGDAEDSGGDGGDDDDNNFRRRAYGYFADVLGRSVRPVESCFPFLSEVRVPGIENIRLLHHCNGLLLFGYIQEPEESLNYIVSNPATQQWVAVPSSDGNQSSLTHGTLSSLIFDPAASSYFHLVQIKDEEEIPVQVYSSKSGVWSCVGREWKPEWGCDDLYIAPDPCGAYVNGMLYVVLYGIMDRIAEMDVEGNTRKTIPVPLQEEDEEEENGFWQFTDYVGQSQGRLHCIYHADQSYLEEHPPEKRSYELFIWVLEDFETQQWVLKDTVSFLHLFGKRICRIFKDYNVVAIHPDHNLVYLVQHCNRKLISYNMDTKEVRHLCTLEQGYRCITPYVPCFSELSKLEI
ncbi:unnamed protein product [Urochloa decumbens]|uniref:F-box domain-containing protein n=1 Tax=Urochloa decumbens TaxID=240449 RepID=A0ABC9GA98_9POAL